MGLFPIFPILFFLFLGYMDLATEVKNFLQSDAGQDAVAGSGQSAEVCLDVLLALSEMSAQEIKKSPRFNSPEGMWFL